jgi:hypothetical protein
LRVRSDGGDRIARRAETEPVERKRRCFFATRGHDKSSLGETCRWHPWDDSFVAKVTSGNGEIAVVSLHFVHEPGATRR